MNHLIVSREFPPAPCGGIGTYAQQISWRLAESGESVHVISQLWAGAEKPVEEFCGGRLVVHRIPYEDWSTILKPRPNPRIRSKIARDLYQSDYPAKCFSWQASLLAEQLIEREGIDVIECQDFEAPLFYYQLRRAHGLGPRKRPPCIVHLHSPTRFIGRHNDWNLTLLRWRTANEMEDYSIQSADKLLCPSGFFARQAESHYGLAPGTIEVIPYPLGDAPPAQRPDDVWSKGSVCYVGRLEKRKGILEWLNAAVAVAQENRSVHFEFAGANVIAANRLLSEQYLSRAIPRAVKPQFTFHGELPRSALPKIFAQARIAVVPSRWDNFPNTCMEALQSGLPVIATQEGGMVEMIADGQTGWLAKAATAASLSDALRRALGTAPERLAEMGKMAAIGIGELCGSERITQRHLSFRTNVVEQGAKPTSESPDRWRDSRAYIKKLLAAPGGHDPAIDDDGLLWEGSDRPGRAGRGAFIPPFLQRPSYSPQELLATLRCIVGDPRVAYRVLRRAAAQISRPRK